MTFDRKNLLFLFIVIALTVVVKIVCAPQINLSGFSPVIAICLFSGFAVKDKRKAFLLPIICLFASDLVLQVLYLANVFPFAGLYKWQFLNYTLFIVITLLGIGLGRLKTTGLVVSALAGPVLFFLLSNFFVWAINAEGMGYAKDFSGLLQCYTFGLPFFRNSLIATIVFLPSILMLYNGVVKSRYTLQPIAVK